MPRFFKQLLIEITLFVSLVTLAGHVTVNFWERYVVVNKLSDMKNSLDHLKVTVHNMAYAYDDLQRDLVDLTRCYFKPDIASYETQRKGPSKKGIDDKILLERLNSLIGKVNLKAQQLHAADKTTESAQVSKKDFAKNAMTITRFPITTTAVGSDRVSILKKKPGKH